MTPNFEDFIGLLLIAWVFIYLTNLIFASVLAAFYEWIQNDGGIKIRFPK